MNNLIAKAHAHILNTLAEEGERERGASALELVIIAAGLISVAVIVVAAVTAAVNSRLGGIV